MQFGSQSIKCKAAVQKKYRRLIFLFFLLLFFTSIPFILLYTAGYSYNLKKNKFEKTGALLVNTPTKDAVLYLNYKPYYSKGEFRINNLLPGEYDAKLSATGYLDWQKKLLVQSKLTTFAKDIRLWKNSLPINIINQEIISIYPSPNKNKLLFISGDTKTKKYALSVFDAIKKESRNIMSLKGPPVRVSWSADNEKFSVETADEVKVADANKGDITPGALQNKSRTRWDEKNGSKLYTQGPDGIYKTDLLFQSAAKIWGLSHANDFAAASGYIYITDGKNLKQINISEKTVVSVPLEREKYQIQSIRNNKIYLFHPWAEKLQIFNLPLEALSTPALLANAKDFDIFDNNLLYYNDFELWIYNFESDSKELVTRIGAEIKKARWLLGASNILFILDNQLKIIELDKRDKRQIFNLVKFDEINDFVLTKKYEIYFIGKMNGSSGLYELEI